MNIISKYALLVLLIANLLSQSVVLSWLSDFLFYGILGVSVLNLPLGIKRISIRNIKATSFLWFFVGVLFVYQITLGLHYIEWESISYLSAKVMVSIIIFWAITSNYEFYLKKMIPFLSIVIAVMIVLGYIFWNESFGGRSTCGFGNFNSTGSISLIGTIGFLFFRLKPSFLRYAGFVVCLFGLIISGSRTAIGVCIIALFLKFRFSVKSLILIGACAIAASYLLPSLGFETSGIERVSKVIEEGDFVSSRGDVREATELMISQRPIQGWGLNTVVQGEARKISPMGSHNGYLDMARFIGIPFSIVLLIGTLVILFKIRSVVKSQNNRVMGLCAIVICTFAAAFYEAYIIGVNHILTNLMFLSVAMLQYHCYYQLEEENGE